MNVSLTPELEELVNKKVKSGMYHSASEVIREGLRLLKEQDELKEYRLNQLRKPDQAELQRRSARLFEEDDRTIREPGKPLTDPYEAAWAQGVEEKARKMGLKL